MRRRTFITSMVAAVVASTVAPAAEFAPIKLLESARPTPQLQEFIDFLTREMALGMGIPLALLLSPSPSLPVSPSSAAAE